MKRSWKEMSITSVRSVQFDAPPERVWTALTKSQSESGSSVQKLDREDFESYRPSANESVFCITSFEPGILFAFELKNVIMTGTYSAEFTALDNHGTHLRFTDKIVFNNRLSWLIATYGLPLKKSQKLRIQHLKELLAKDGEPSPV